jgi:signal transduction histidine kinase
MASSSSGAASDAACNTPRESRAPGSDGAADGRNGGPASTAHGLAPASDLSDSDPVEEPDAAGRLRAQYAEISQLAGGLAHEIRNPLSTVSLNLDMLAEDFQNPETPRDRRVRERIERLRLEVHRLYGILENFLRFARIQDLQFADTDLNAIVEELCDFYQPYAASRSIVMRTQFAADLPPIRLDAELFKQALLNLVLNAEHAMPSGGELILTTRRQGRWVLLDVTDTGVGMTEEVRARIFDAFFSTRSGGSGLGLPTSRKIIEAHGGSIHVESEPGKGSQFTIRLPAGGSDSPDGPQVGEVPG